MKQKLDEQEESALNITETYNSLQQEVDVKTKKLKKVNNLFLISHISPGSRIYSSFFHNRLKEVR